MQTATTIGTVTMYPLLRYRDAEAAIGWLVNTLGLAQLEIVRGDDDRIVHAELNLGSGVIMLGSNLEDQTEHCAQEIYVAIDQIDAYYEQVKAAGADITRPIRDTDYGSRDFGVRDLDGNAWYFGTYRPQVAG